MISKISKFLYPKDIPDFSRNITIKKYLNWLKTKLSLKFKMKVNMGMPYQMQVDVTNQCNLKCPFCPTGKGLLPRPKGALSFEEFELLTMQIKDYLFCVYFYLWGEPFINLDIFKMVKYCRDNKIHTSIHSNILLLKTPLIEKLLESGLDYLSVSIDGASQESYQKYRIGGDFTKAINNLKSLIMARNSKGLDRPFIRWQFLVFKHNEHEIERAKDLVNEIGVNEIYFCGGGVEDPDWATTIEDYNKQASYVSDFCSWLWTHMVLQADGSVSPCCWTYRPEQDFGNIKTNSLKEIWNGDKYVAARSLFSKSNNILANEDLVCLTCNRLKQFRKK